MSQAINWDLFLLSIATQLYIPCKRFATVGERQEIKVHSFFASLKFTTFVFVHYKIKLKMIGLSIKF